MVRCSGAVFVVSGHHISVAASARSRPCVTAYCKRLPGFDCCNPLCAPTTDDLVQDARTAPQEAFALAKWQIVPAAEVEHMTHVEVAVSVVALDPEAGDVRRAITNIAAIQQVAGVAAAPRVRVGRQECQTVREALLQACLESIIVAVAFGRVIACALTEVRIWQVQPYAR